MECEYFSVVTIDKLLLMITNYVEFFKTYQADEHKIKTFLFYFSNIIIYTKSFVVHFNVKSKSKSKSKCVFFLVHFLFFQISSEKNQPSKLHVLSLKKTYSKSHALSFHFLFWVVVVVILHLRITSDSQ